MYIDVTLLRYVRIWPYPCAVIGHGAAAGQAGVEVGDAVRAADRGVFMDLTAAVHVAAPSQVPLGHSHGGPAGRRVGG